MKAIGFAILAITAIAAHAHADNAKQANCAQGDIWCEDPTVDTDAKAAAMRTASGAAASSIVKAAPTISLEGTTTDKTVLGQFGLQYHRVSLTIGAKAAVGKDPTATTTLADLDGLRNKTTGEFGIYSSHWLGVRDPAPVLGPVCDEYGETTGKTENKDFKCRLGWFKKDPSAAGRKAYQAIIDKISAPTIFFWGGKGSIAPEEFKFVGKTDLKSGTERHTSWSFSALAGVAFKSNTVVTASYRRQVAYKAGDTAQVCSPVGTTDSSTCTEKVLGAPGSPDKTNTLSLEFKQFFGAHFAVAPKINRDFTKSVTGIEAPIYLLRDKTGGLTGGVTLGWRSDKKEFTASAFVGPVLRLITK